MFGILHHFHSSLIFTSKNGAYSSGDDYETSLLRVLKNLHSIIRLGQKLVIMTNTLAYYNTEWFSASNVFPVGLTLEANTIKLFNIISSIL